TIRPSGDLIQQIQVLPIEDNFAFRSARYLCLLLLIPCCSTATLAQSDEYDVVNLGPMPGGSGMVRGINNSGYVVGRSGTEFNRETRGFIWRGENQVQQLASLPGAISAKP